MSKRKIFLIDGSAVVYRAYYAFYKNPMINSKGKNVGAIFGSLNIFLNLFNKFQMKNVVITFDQKGKTFRNKIDANYKSNRPPMPADLIEQMEHIQRAFSILGVCSFKKDNYEADDVLGTLANIFKSEFEVVLISGDKDFIQLLDNGITIYDPMKNRFIDEKFVYEKFGVKPSQFIDYLAIVGDGADNIPGVRGIGKIGAKNLLLEHKSLENIYKNIEKIKTLKKKLIENRENAFLSYKLATIITDLSFESKDTSFSQSRFFNLKAFAREFGLKLFLKKINFLENTDINQLTPSKQMTIF